MLWNCLWSRKRSMKSSQKLRLNRWRVKKKRGLKRKFKILISLSSMKRRVSDVSQKTLCSSNTAAKPRLYHSLYPAFSHKFLPKNNFLPSQFLKNLVNQSNNLWTVKVWGNIGNLFHFPPHIFHISMYSHSVWEHDEKREYCVSLIGIFFTWNDLVMVNILTKSVFNWWLWEVCGCVLLRRG